LEHAAAAGGQLGIVQRVRGNRGSNHAGAARRVEWTSILVGKRLGRRDHPEPDRSRPARRPRRGVGRGRRALRGHRGLRGLRRQAAAGPPPHGLCHAGRTDGRRDPRAGAENHYPGRSRLSRPRPPTGPYPMAKIVVTGGNALNGEVNVSGAKNAVLPILCATLLADAPVEITNVPHLNDVINTVKLLGELGAKVAIDQGTLSRGSAILVDPRSVNQHVAYYELVK